MCAGRVSILVQQALVNAHDNANDTNDSTKVMHAVGYIADVAFEAAPTMHVYSPNVLCFPSKRKDNNRYLGSLTAMIPQREKKSQENPCT